ncbi:serine/threonine-protein kinase [Streptomyces sp. Amel2xB2]|uniref:serine/threonine-protein kinase n=1 Tax=Streptomyces sp. Amel2xB2 TaxID=1305829 RepID=UPI0021AC0BE1|nr:serine/threonine-protein kinase [Streptomyces sp. Amel2xB2]
MAMMRLRREDPRVVGSFRLHRRLGAGGMGVVYLGSDRRGQRVALKVIRPDLAEDNEFRSRFAREVSAARRIRGGCTARLVAADLDADRPWFATQYVPGPSLHDKVTEAGPLPASQVASIGASLAEGLVAVHEAGVVHRDLKPSNILLSPKGPRIIDFGIAWATGASTLTHVGTAVGSPGFLSPEQVRGALVTPATDVFALGATLAYAATADSPFGQGSSEVMLYRVVHEEPQLESVHAALAPLLQACLVKAPEERPSPLQLSLRLKEIAAREARGLSEQPGGGAGADVAGRGNGSHGGHAAHGSYGPAHGADGESGRGTAASGGAAGGRPSSGRGTGRTSANGGSGANRQYPSADSARGGSGAGAAGGARGGNVPRSRLPGNGRPRLRRTEERGRPRAEGARYERHRDQQHREHGTSGGPGAASGGSGAGSGSASGGGPAGSPRGSTSRTGGERAANTGAGGGRSSAARTATRTGGGTGGRGGPARRPGTGTAKREQGQGAARRGADRRLLRQRLVVFVTVTVLVALGIAMAQGCQGPTQGLGGERAPVRPATEPAAPDVPGPAADAHPGAGPYRS